MANKVIVISDGSSAVYNVVPGRTAEQIAAVSGVTDPAFYQEFPESDFDPACYNFSSAFTLVAGVVGFDLPAAKVQATSQEKSKYSTLEATATDGYSANQLASQGALPEIDRLPEVQAVIDAVNVLAVELSTKLAAIAAATTIDEINSIVNNISGTISTGRSGSGGGPLDMNPSTMSVWNSTTVDVTDTELYIPASSSVVPYDAGLAPYTYAQTFGAFTVGNYTVQLRQISSGITLAEWVCPLSAVNVPVDF